MNIKIKNIVFTGLMLSSVGVTLPMENVRIKELCVLYDSGNLNSMQFPVENASELIDRDIAILEKNNKDLLVDINRLKGFIGQNTIVGAVSGSIALPTNVFAGGVGYIVHNIWKHSRFLNLTEWIKEKQIDVTNVGYLDDWTTRLQFYGDKFQFLKEQDNADGKFLRSFIIPVVLGVGYVAIVANLIYISNLLNFFCVVPKIPAHLTELNKSFEQNFLIIVRLKTIKASL